MKNFRTLSILVLCVLSMGVLTAEIKPDEWYSEAGLRSLVVESPDSLLTLLGSAGRCHDAISLPQYKLDLLRCLAYNEKRLFPMVERYALRALADDSINNHHDIRLNLLTLLSTARIVTGDYRGSLRAAYEGLTEAREAGNRAAEYNLLITLAKVSFGMGERQNGYDYLAQVIDRGSGSQVVNELANVSAAYGVKIVELYNDGRFDEALSESGLRLALITRIDEIGGAPSGFTDQQRAYTYARIASSAQRAGRIAEAERAFRMFMSTDYGNTVIGRSYITDYLLDSGQWSKVLDFTRPLYAVFGPGDSISWDFHSLLMSNAEAESRLGNYSGAYRLLSRGNVIQDSLYYRERNSAAQELELHQVKAEADRKQTLLLTVCVVTMVIFVSLIIIMVQYRDTLRRNRIASRQIDEMQAQREIIHKIEDKRENETYTRFVTLERSILDSKKYLDPNYNRESLFAECSNLPKSRVSQLIQQYAGLTVNNYINKLRVEYSVKLIQEHPEWTIDAIAAASGYIRKATFYTNFDKVFGVTPAQYRKQNSGSNDAE